MCSSTFGVFAQLMAYLPLSTFRRCVARYDGERKVKSFSCLDQFYAMAFAQLTFRESLRDIETCDPASRLPPAASAALAAGCAPSASAATRTVMLYVRQGMGATSSFGIEPVVQR